LLVEGKKDLPGTGKKKKTSSKVSKKTNSYFVGERGTSLLEALQGEKKDTSFTPVSKGRLHLLRGGRKD